MTDLDWRPSHPYVPGRGRRHEEGIFDFIKAGVNQCCVDELPDTAAWQYAIAFHNEGYYWEAHEILETVWMACPPNSAEKIYVQGLIQRANAALKESMGQLRAALKISREADLLIEEAQHRSGGVLFNGRVEL